MHVFSPHHRPGQGPRHAPSRSHFLAQYQKKWKLHYRRYRGYFCMAMHGLFTTRSAWHATPIAIIPIFASDFLQIQTPRFLGTGVKTFLFVLTRSSSSENLWSQQRWLHGFQPVWPTSWLSRYRVAIMSPTVYCNILISILISYFQILISVT